MSFAADQPHHAAADGVTASAPREISTINPVTGLSTDYLNHFTEAVMVLEMGTTMPDCLEELNSWRPKTYREHFLASAFRDRGAIIAAYDAANPAIRDALDRNAAALNDALSEVCAEIVARLGMPDAVEAARQALVRIKPLVARTTSILNGYAAGNMGAQASVDALFRR